MEMKNKVKYILTLVEMTLLKLLWLLPIKKDEVLFLSYDGKQYSDSPRCLSEVIHDRYPGKKLIWALNNTDNPDVPEYARIIDRNSFEFLRTISTVGTIISNNSLSSYIPIRKKQIFLNTWHGGSPTKTVGFKESNPNPYYKYHFRIQDSKTTAIISSSEFFTREVIGESFGFEKTEVLEAGLPRNDVLLADHENIINKVYDYFSLKRSSHLGLVLYAPTFRGDANNSTFLKPEEMIPVEQCVVWLKEKFNKDFVFLFRAHHAMKADCLPGSMSATEYPDMQELLCAADVLITDYSSCMHDFSLMKKPVFLYIPDYKEYMADRGFYYDIPTMPFPYAESLPGFEMIIKEFDTEEFNCGVDKYFDRLGNYDDGNATNRTIKWLEEKWKNGENKELADY